MPVSAGLGSVGVQISWPQRAGDVQPALVPLASESIKVQLIRDGVPVPGGTTVINRPHTQAIIEGVAAGEAILRAAMYPEPDGQGVAQAAGETAIWVIPGQMRGYGLVLGSTIERIDISPAAAEVREGEALQLSATASNSRGEVVLVPLEGGFTWTVLSGEDHLTVDETGLVSGRRAGEATIQATEEESGISGTITVVVMPRPQ